MSTDKERQIVNTGFYVLPILIGNLVPVLTLPVFTRMLSPEDFGAWALANAFAAVAGGLAAVGLPIAYERAFFEDKDGTRRAHLLYSLVGFTLTSFAVAGAITWMFRGVIARIVVGDVAYGGLIMWSLLATAVAAIKTFYMSELRNSERAFAFAIFMIAERLLSAVLSVLLIAWMRVGVAGLVIAQGAATLLVLIVLAGLFVRRAPIEFDSRILKDSLRLGYPLMPRTLLGVVGNNVDKYLIGQISSLGGVGIYSIGQRVSNIAFTYMTALQNVFGPRVYSMMFSGEPDAGQAIGRYLTPFLYVSTSLAFLIAMFSEEILRLLAPPEFHGAILIVAILAGYNAIQFFGKIPQLVYARKTHWISAMAAVTTVLTAGIGAAGIALGGTVGAAVGALLASALSLLATNYLGQKCFRIGWEYRKAALIFSLFFGGAALTIALRTFEVAYVVRLAVKIATVGLFALVGVKLKVITVANLALVRDLVLRRRAAR